MLAEPARRSCWLVMSLSNARFSLFQVGPGPEKKGDSKTSLSPHGFLVGFCRGAVLSLVGRGHAAKSACSTSR